MYLQRSDSGSGDLWCLPVTTESAHIALEARRDSTMLWRRSLMLSLAGPASCFLEIAAGFADTSEVSVCEATPIFTLAINVGKTVR